MTAGDDLQALHQWYAGGEHGGDLTGDDGDIHRFDLGAALGEEPLGLLGHLGDVDPLLAQFGLDGVDAVCLQLAGDLLPLAVYPVPAEGEDFLGGIVLFR